MLFREILQGCFIMLVQNLRNLILKESFKLIFFFFYKKSFIKHIDIVLKQKIERARVASKNRFLRVNR